MPTDLANLESPPRSVSPKKDVLLPESLDRPTGTTETKTEPKTGVGNDSSNKAPQLRGSFKIETADKTGNPVRTKDDPPQPAPSDPRARVLVFEIDSSGPQPPPKEQLELRAKLEQLVSRARRMFRAGVPRAEQQFRLHFVSLFNTARLGLEGKNVATREAMSEVARIEAELTAALKLRGSFKIETADEAGNPVRTKDDPPKPAPSDPRARVLVFEIDSSGPQPPSKEQLELYAKLEQIAHAARTVFPAQDPRAEQQFRLHFVSLFNTACWGLEGENVATDEAKKEVARIEAELIEDAAGLVKNKHLKTLGLWAALLAVPFLAAYFVLHLYDSTEFVAKLQLFHTTPDAMGNFMLLWIGCFVGVCLSYALRTQVPTLADLTAPDKDYLWPGIRLLFAGSLTMLIVMFAVVGFFDVKIGTWALTSVTTNDTLAFVVGAICGISELALPGKVGKKAGDLIASA